MMRLWVHSQRLDVHLLLPAAAHDYEAAGMTRDGAENEPSDEATDAERGSSLHRSRRAPGQSRSCSPDDHQ
ncbi:hypothetical protein Bca52824_083431 [Brassica carinata]|uniref:Uncharacterized protein n=1 Tax=Brassica carinata TaxID=52824 RepID=A0A8X7PKS5_BRACI|nr:hypothetical protein Bca52824_083431 [Brassica carinata]